MTLATVISRPAAHPVRSVTSDLDALTRKWAIKDMAAAATSAADRSPDPAATPPEYTVGGRKYGAMSYYGDIVVD